MSWSKVKKGNKPIGWWYHKIMCELSWHCVDHNKWYYYHLNKMCDKYNINLYGEDLWPYEPVGKSKLHNIINTMNDIKLSEQITPTLKKCISALLEQSNSDIMRIGKTPDGELYAFKLTESLDFYDPWDEEEINLT